MYVLEPKVINELEENKPLDFTDIIREYKMRGEKVGVFPVSEQAWLDMGQFDEMEKMRRRIEGNE